MSVYFDTATRLARVAPQLRPAGVGGNYAQGSVRELTSSYRPEGCSTPDKLKLFGHRGPELGEPRRNHVAAADFAAAPADDATRHGVTRRGEGGSADECLRPGLFEDKMLSLEAEQREKNYASARLRPLGRGPLTDEPVPVPLHGFGLASKKGESTASTLSAMRDVDVVRPAGAQTDRGYDWQSVGIDPTERRFGGVVAATGESAAACMGGAGRRTLLVPKIGCEFNGTVQYEVGKPRSHGFDNPADWDASKRRSGALRATASNGFQVEQPTIKDLLSAWAAPHGSEEGTENGGRSGKGGNSDGTGSSLSGSGKGNTLRETVRTVTRGGRGVDALAAMEDEATVAQLVHPSHYVSIGVQSRYFAGGRDLEETRALATKVGFGMTDAQVDEVFAANAVGGKCGIEQFKNAAFAKGYMY